MTNNDDYSNYVGGGELDDGDDDDKGEPPMDLFLILGKYFFAVSLTSVNTVNYR